VLNPQTDGLAARAVNLGSFDLWLVIPAKNGRDIDEKADPRGFSARGLRLAECSEPVAGRQDQPVEQFFNFFSPLGMSPETRAGQLKANENARRDGPPGVDCVEMCFEAIGLVPAYFCC
jgi:hypothetical protein